jgi:predicted PurR-regulated permease PerM
LHEQVPGRVTGLTGAAEFWPEGPELAAQLPLGLGRMLGAQRPRDDSGVCDVLVPLVADQRVLAIAVVGGEEAVEFGDVDPGEQVRVVCCVRPAVASRPDDSFVHAVHDVDGLLRLRRGPERRSGEEVGSALQPAPRIVAVVGEFGNPCHREWMQRLEEERPHPPDEHRRIRMYPSDRCILGEPSGFVGVEQLDASFLCVRADDAITDLATEPIAKFGRRRRHCSIVSRDAEYHPNVPEETADDPKVSADNASPSDGGQTDSQNGGQAKAQNSQADRQATDRLLPRWVVPGVAVFWTGFLLSFVARHVFHRLASLLILLLVSLFLALAIEPGVNKLAFRGWRRGRATLLILLGVLFAFLVFLVAIGTLVGTQIADLLSESNVYIRDTVQFLNDSFGTQIDPQAVIDEVNDPNGRVQGFIQSQGDEAVRLSLTALGVIFQGLSVILFTYYLVADGPRLRRIICSRLTPQRQARVLNAWELAINKTGGYLYSRALLALLSAFFHWIVFQALGIQAPIALALWVGLVSQFLPVVGTYLAGILPVLVTFLDSPLKALIVIGFIVVYQQIENYFFAPRITARTMELHPAVAFGAALAGASLLGAVGAILALPAAAMAQALAGEWGRRYDVVDIHLTVIQPPRKSPGAATHPSSQADSPRTP